MQATLLLLLAAATGARLVAANLDGGHNGLSTLWSLATLCQKVGMQDTSGKAGLGGLLLQMLIAERFQRCRHLLQRFSYHRQCSSFRRGQCGPRGQFNALQVTTTPIVDQRDPLTVSFKLQLGLAFPLWLILLTTPDRVEQVLGMMRWGPETTAVKKPSSIDIEAMLFSLP